MFKKLLYKLRLLKPKTYTVRQYGTIMGAFLATSEEHALEIFAKTAGYKNFEALGVPREAHKFEVRK